MKKTAFIFIFLLSFNIGFAQTQTNNLPYPIIFVHGIDSDNTMWNDITNHLNLWFGSAQVVNLVLNASFDTTRFIDDVIIEFRNTPPLSNGNIFTVNFKNWWNENAADPMLLQGQNHGHILTQSQSNESSILKQGYALKLVIEKVLQATNSDGVILVGHSMGGLAIREYLQRKDENGSQMWWVNKNDVLNGHMVKKVFTLNTPHLGSPFAETNGKTTLPNVYSEATRDLRDKYKGIYGLELPGVYLFGGREQSISIYSGFFNYDVNCDGDEKDSIIGISQGTSYNPNLSLPPNIYYTWGTSTGDAIVPHSNSWLYDQNNVAQPPGADTLLTDDGHLAAKHNVPNIIRGLDEPNTKELAYDLTPNNMSFFKIDRTLKGFITYQPAPSSFLVDNDFYKVVLPAPGDLKVSLGGESSGIQQLAVISGNNTVAITTLPGEVSLQLAADTHYIRVRGFADDQSWQNPYTLNVKYDIGAPPQGPNNLRPSNGAIFVHQNLSIDWSDVEKAITYDFQLATDSLFSNLISSQTGLTSSTIDVSNLELEKKYYWRVRSVNYWGVSDWSEIWSFTTEDALAVGKVNSKPSGGNWGDPKTWIDGKVPLENEDVIIRGPVTIGNDNYCKTLIIMGQGSIQSGYQSNSNIHLSGNLLNYGTIKDNQTGFSLYVWVAGNVTNLNEISASSLVLNGSGNQFIGQGNENSFNCNISFSNSGGDLVAGSPLVFKKNVSLGGGKLQIGEYTTKITEGGTILGGEVVGKNLYYYSTALFRDMLFNVRNLFMRGILFNCTFQGPVSFNGRIQISDGNTIYGNLSVVDTLESFSRNYNYNTTTLQINGSLTNNGVVRNYPDNYDFNRLNISINGNVTNHGIMTNYSTTVSGNITNNGAISNSTTYSLGDVTNNGELNSGWLYLVGTSNQYLFLESNKSFNCEISFANTTGELIAGTDLKFNKHVHLNGKRFLTGDYLVVTNAYIINGEVNQPNFRFYGDGILKSMRMNVRNLFMRGKLTNSTFQGPVSFYEKIQIDEGDTIYGNLTIVDTLENYGWYPNFHACNLQINGSLFNNGLIRENPNSTSSYLKINITENLTNNGEMKNNTTYSSGDVTNNGELSNGWLFLDGTGNQHLYLGVDKSFDREINFINTGGDLVAGTALRFNRNVNLNGGRLVTVDFTVNVPDGVWITNGKISQQNFRFQGNGTLDNIQLDVRNLYMRGGLYNCNIQGPVSFYNRIQIGLGDTINGNLTVEDTLENGFGDTLQLNGSLFNNGLVRTNPDYYLKYLSIHITENLINNGELKNSYIHIAGDVTNDGVISGGLYLNGGISQHLFLGADKAFDCQIYFTNSTGDLIAGTNLRFNTDVALQGGRLRTDDKHIFASKGVRIKNGEISQSSLLFFGDGILENIRLDVRDLYMRGILWNCDIMGPVTFHDRILINPGDTINGNLTVADTLQNFDGYSESNEFTLQINGNLSNNGVIRTNPNGNSSLLRLNIKGNLTNNGVLNYIFAYVSSDVHNNGEMPSCYLYLDGTGNQYLYLGDSKVFDCGINFLNTTGDLVAGTALSFSRNVTLYGGKLVTGDFSVRASKGVYIIGGTISQPTFRFYGDGALNDILLDVRSLYMRGSLLDCTFQGPVTFYERVQIQAVTTINGNLTVVDTLESGGTFADSYEYKLHINGNLFNNGIIRDNSNYLRINITGDLNNNGMIGNSSYYLIGNSSRTLHVGDNCVSNFYSEGDSVILVGQNKLPNLYVNSGTCLLAKNSELIFLGGRIHGNFHNYGKVVIGRPISTNPSVYDFFMSNVKLGSSTGLNNLVVTNFGNQVPSLFSSAVKNYWGVFPDPSVSVNSQIMTFSYKDGMLNGNEEDKLEIFHSGNGVTDWTKLSNPRNTTRNLAENYLQITDLPIQGYFAIASSANFPSQVILTAPDNDRQNLNLPVLFKWQSDYLAERYLLSVAKDSLFTELVLADSSLSDTTKLLSNLENNVRYFWRVKAGNQTGWGDWSNTWRFTTIIEKPTVPVLALPVNGSKGLLNPITAKWDKSLRVEKYRLQASTDSLFGSFIMNDSTLTDTTKLLPNLANYSQYYWRVKAVNVGGESDWSTVWNFKTLGNPYATNLLTPLDAAINHSIAGLTFKWTKAKERIETIQKYQFQLSTDSLFASTFVNDSTLTDTMKVVGGMGYLTKYFWRVRAQNQTGWGDWSNTWGFTTVVEKPTIPLLASPLNNTKGLLNPITAKWNKSLRVEKYRLQVSADSLFGSLVLNDSTLTDTTKLLPNLANYSQYYWRVKAVNVGGESDWSNVWNFKTLGNPYASNLITPLDASINQPLNGLTFKWTKAKERIETIQKYQLQISTDSLFASLFLNDSTLTDTSRLVNGLNHMTNYFWRVRAKNEVGWGNWSNTWRFTTIIDKPTVPVLVLPGNGGNGLLNPITAKWNKSLRVEKYKLQVSTDSLFGLLVVNDSTLTDTTKLLPNLANFSQYYWRVKAVNVGGESDWSTVWNFKTLGNPYASNLITPLDASVNQPLNGLTFKWTKAKERIETIQKYQFQLSTDSLFTTTFVNDSTLTDTTKIVGGMGYLTKYFWRVRAQNQTGWGDWSNTWRFTTVIEKPTIPVLALPLNNTKGLLNPITAKWNKSLRVEKYKLQVSTDSLFGTLVMNDSTLADTTKLLPSLANYSQYYWRVKAVNVGGESDWSTVWNFKTLGNPYASNLLTPMDASVNQPLNELTFKWTKAKERIETIQKYQFQISTDSLFRTVFVIDSTLTDTMKVVGGMGYLTKYFWRVRAQNQTGWGDWSQVWRFTTITEKPTIPLLALPGNGSKGLLNPITTKWNKSLRVEKYKVQVSTDSLFSSFIVNDSTLTDTTRLLPTLANYSQYFWRVKAVNVGGESDWSTVWNFKTLGNPYASNLIAPLDNTVNLPLNGLTFKWTRANERIETIQKYQFQISTDSLFASTFVNDSTLTDTIKIVGGMGYLTKYFWRVRAQNQTGWGDWSNTWRFTTIIEKPTIPVLASPLNNSRGLLNPITAKWNKSLRVEKYGLQVSTDSLFGSFIVNDSTLTDTTKLLPNLANYSQYYWRLKAVNVGGESDWSTVWNFKTLGNPYSSNLIAPLDASVNQPLNGLTFKWTKAKERIETIQKYQFQVSTDSLFTTTFVNDSTLTDTSKVVGGMAYFTKYFWRVRAQNQTGWGDWSNTWRFTTIIDKPTVPVLALPVNGSKGLPNPIIAKWNKSLRVEKYKLQVSTDSLFSSFIVNDSTLTDTTKLLQTLADYSQYYWRVKAVNVGGESDWSSVWNFKTLGNPYASNLITPLDASVNQPLNGLTFEWTKAKERIESIQKYQLQVSTDSLFTTVFVNDSTLTDTMKVVGGMGYLTKYFWRVRAQNQTGWGDWSNTWRFTTIIEKPAIPVLALPLNNSKGLLNPITAKWNKSLRVEKYKLQVSTDSLFGSFVVNDTTLADTTKLLPNLANYSQYYWRVKAVNIGGESNWSTVWNFKTLGNPYSVILASPGNGAVNNPVNNVTFRWFKPQERTETILKYHFQLSTDSLFGSIAFSDSTFIMDTTTTGSGLSYLTTYFWRVRAKNETGWGDWSQVWSLTTVIEKPSVPLLASPANNATQQLQPVILKWKQSLRVEKYTLEVSESSNFTTLFLVDSTLTDTMRTLPQLQTPRTYYWRVKARNIGGTSEYSTVWNFRTLGFPIAVHLIAPANGSVNLPINGVLLKWSTAGEQTLGSVTSGGNGAKKGRNDEKQSIDEKGRNTTKSGNLFATGSANPTSGIESIGKYWLEIKTDTSSATLFYSDSTLTDTTKLMSGFGYLTTYFWRVKANNEVGWGSFSEWFKFTTIIERPTQPVLASPANNSLGLIQPVTVKWNRADRAERYTLEVSSNAQFTTVVFKDTTITDTTKTLPALSPLTSYYWRVSARNTGGVSDTSSVWNFKTLGTPTVVTLVTPENNAVNVPINNVVFNWTKANDRLETIQKYRFELKTDTTSGTFVVLDTLLTDTTKIVASLQNLTGYYWRISAKNEAGWGEFTPWNRFTTVKKPIATPTALTAIATAVKKVTLSWTDNSDNELGFIILRKSGDSTSTATLVRIDSVGANITEFIDTTVTDTSYYSYKVMAYNADTLSNQSNFATVFTLTGIRELAGDIPKEFNLYQNYPNPFNPSTIIRFAIPKDAHVEIELYSIHGELVQKLVSEDKQAGYYEISLELPAYASGIYFYRIVATHEGNAEPFVQTRKLILMK